MEVIKESLNVVYLFFNITADSLLTEEYFKTGQYLLSSTSHFEMSNVSLMLVTQWWSGVKSVNMGPYTQGA